MPGQAFDFGKIGMYSRQSVVAKMIAPALGVLLFGAIAWHGGAEPVNDWVAATGTPTLTESRTGQLHESWGGAGIAVHAPFGTNGQGHALAVGDRLTFSGFVTNTSFNWGNEQFRFGLFHSSGEASELVTNWVGYWIPNTVGGGHSDGPHKKIAGQTNGFWETRGTVLVGPVVAATGYATGGNLPHGVYAFSIMLARVDANNLNISWELRNVLDGSMNPVNGIYSFAGTATDGNVSEWSFNRAILFTGNSSGTVSYEELDVTLAHKEPTVASLPPKMKATTPTSAESPVPKDAPHSDNGWAKAAQNEPDGRSWLILTGLAGIIGLLIWGILIVKRLARSALLAQQSRELSARMIGNDPGRTSADSWRQRALAAEALAAKQNQILDEKVGPELREFAKEALVQGLYHQRNALMETQTRAQQALAELESRLSELHLPVHERIHAYEKRIAELEKELETRGEEMRELTKATLLLVKQKLEQERESSAARVKWE
jgi:hypothetical protein